MTAITTSQCSSVSQLLDAAAEAFSGEDFSALVCRALRRSADAADFDDCFVELRSRLQGWLGEPPANVDAVDAALAFTEFVERFTPAHGARWYPVRDHDRYPDVSDWFCQDAELLAQIEESMFDPGSRRSPADAAGALLARLHLHVSEAEVFDA